ncbi:MAG: TetR/AcrR family transcriptional regulator [Bacteroidia bacterium]
MPSVTFEKLSSEKRNRFIEAALLEFSQHNFEMASINRIIKKLGIARGSVYQYFEDKVDLWLYLKSYAEQQKVTYIQAVQRSDYDSFWDYYAAVYESGINFHIEDPLSSLFLYRVGFKEQSEGIREHLNGWNKRADEMLTLWVEAEREAGTFSTEVSTPMIVLFLRTMSSTIADLIQEKCQIDFDAKMLKGEALIGSDRRKISEAVAELVSLLKKSLT